MEQHALQAFRSSFTSIWSITLSDKQLPTLSQPFMKTLAFILLLASAIIAASTPTYSQSYRLSPGNSLLLTGMMEDQQTLIISQVNTSSKSLNFRWKKLSASVPEKWESSICDNLICYTSLVDSGAMSELLPGDSSYILLHITPRVTYGEAVIRYLIWDNATPLIIDTLTFTLVVSPNSAPENMARNEDIILFPNPTHDAISLTTTTPTDYTYSMTDMLGTVLMSGTASAAPLTLDLHDYPIGVYTLTIITGNKHSTRLCIKL